MFKYLGSTCPLGFPAANGNLEDENAQNIELPNQKEIQPFTKVNLVDLSMETRHPKGGGRKIEGLNVQFEHNTLHNVTSSA